MMIRLDGEGNLVPDTRMFCADVLAESYNPRFQMQHARPMTGGEKKKRRKCQETKAKETEEEENEAVPSTPAKGGIAAHNRRAALLKKKGASTANTMGASKKPKKLAPGTGKEKKKEKAAPAHRSNVTQQRPVAEMQAAAVAAAAAAAAPAPAPALAAPVAFPVRALPGIDEFEANLPRNPSQFMKDFMENDIVDSFMGNSTVADFMAPLRVGEEEEEEEEEEGCWGVDYCLDQYGEVDTADAERRCASAWHESGCAAGCACETPSTAETPRARLNGLEALSKPVLVKKLRQLRKLGGIIGYAVNQSMSPQTRTRKGQYDAFSDVLITMAHGDHAEAEAICGEYCVSCVVCACVCVWLQP